MQELLDMVGEALTALQCPYFEWHHDISRNFGMCESGCYTEPTCTAGDSPIGYLTTIKSCAEELIQIFERN